MTFQRNEYIYLIVMYVFFNDKRKHLKKCKIYVHEETFNIYIYLIYLIYVVFFYIYSLLTFLWIREINFALFNNKGTGVSKLLQVQQDLSKLCVTLLFLIFLLFPHIIFIDANIVTSLYYNKYITCRCAQQYFITFWKCKQLISFV